MFFIKKKDIESIIRIEIIKPYYYIGKTNIQFLTSFNTLHATGWSKAS